jgi:hypothetical protein
LDTSQLPEAPIFIIGHPRSGTTLLRFILSSHPRIYVPEETGFVPFLVSDSEVDAELSLGRVGAILERIGQLNRLWDGLVDDVRTFYRSLPQPTLMWLLDHLYRLHIADHHAARWGDKTPLYVQYVPLLGRIFPTAQFVHLIRDGRDAALSARQKWPGRRYMDTYYLMSHWVRNISAGRQAGSRLGTDRYLELYYEELVHQPRAAVERLCAFLGEEFQPQMLQQDQLARKVGPGPQKHTEVQQPISAGSVGRWKDQMTAFDQKVAGQLAGPTLSALGYEQAEVGSFSPAEWIRFFALTIRYEVANAIRDLLYGLGVLTLNRGMRR